MLMIALICMFVATLGLAVGVCFFTKNKTLTYLLQTFSYIALLCLILVAGNFKNNFSGYTILLIISIAPQFLNLFDLNGYLKTKKEELSSVEEEYLENKQIGIEKTDEELNQSTQNKKHNFIQSNGTLLQALALLLSSVCISLSGLYLGLETFYGIFIGIAMGFALVFLNLITKKSINPYDLLSLALTCLSVGLLIGNIIIVALYSLSLTNILFCVGSLLICEYAFLKHYIKTNYAEILYFIAMFCLVLTLII